MKRYSIDELTRAKDKNGDYCEYDEVNEIIMNMVDEFAETAKEYEEEIAKKDKLYNELYVITNEEMDKLAAKIARLRKALDEYGLHKNDCMIAEFIDTCSCGYFKALAEKE